MKRGRDQEMGFRMTQRVWVRVLMAVVLLVLLVRFNRSPTKFSTQIDVARLRSDETESTTTTSVRVSVNGEEQEQEDELVSFSESGLVEDDDGSQIAFGNENQEREKFTIIIITWKRYKSLQRLLKSLSKADYLGDRVGLKIQIDGGSGEDWEKTIQISRDFEWKFGNKELVVLDKNRGLAHAWISCWPDPKPDEHVMILEDDLAVSKHWYRWTKLMWQHYGDRPEIAGVTLQRQRLVATNAHSNTVQSFDKPFGYKLLGSWGYSPSPEHWREFLTLDFAHMNPSVPGLITTKWFNRQKRGKMWTQFWIWYCNKHSLYTIYITPPKRRAMASNYRERGVHYGHTRGADYKTLGDDEWNPAWDKPPAVIDLYSWGVKKEGKSYPPDQTPTKHRKTFPPTTPIQEELVEPEQMIPVVDNTEEESNNNNNNNNNIEDQDNSEDDSVDEALTAQDVDDFASSNDSDGDNGMDETTAAMVQTAKQTIKDNILFLQLLNEGFVEMTLAWICNVKDMPHVLERTMFVCTDQASYDQLKAFSESTGIALTLHFQPHEAPSEMRYGHVAYYQYILFRASILKALLTNGVSVFLVESDATWFQDPVEYLLNQVDPSVDVVAMHNDYSHVTRNLNGGFLWFKATKGSVSVIQRLYQGCKKKMARLIQMGKENVGGAGNEQQFIKSLLFSSRLNPNGLAVKTVLLPTDKFAPGLWYKKDYRADSLNPILVLNNWVRGTEPKITRAKALGHWLVDENRQCIDRPSVKAANLAISNDWDLSVFSSLINQIKLDDGGLGKMVMLMHVGDMTLEMTKNWLCNARNVQDLVPHTLLICETQSVCDSLSAFSSKQEGLKLNLYTEKHWNSEKVEFYRSALIYSALELGISPFVITPKSAWSTKQGFVEYLTSSIDSEADIVSTKPDPETQLLGDFVWYKNTHKTKEVMSRFVVGLQKYFFSYHTAVVPNEKTVGKGLKTIPLPIDQPHSPIRTATSKTQFQQKNLWTLANDGQTCSV